MNKLLAYALAACLLVATALGLGLYVQNLRMTGLKTDLQAASAAAKQAQDLRKRDSRALGTLRAENAATAREFEARNAALQEALQRNKPWSDTNVPTDVLEALQRPPGGLPDGLPDSAHSGGESASSPTHGLPGDTPSAKD